MKYFVLRWEDIALLGFDAATPNKVIDMQASQKTMQVVCSPKR